MGCLYKKSPTIFKGWQKRWIVLKDCEFKWYKNDKHTSLYQDKLKYGLIDSVHSSEFGFDIEPTYTVKGMTDAPGFSQPKIKKEYRSQIISGENKKK